MFTDTSTANLIAKSRNIIRELASKLYCRLIGSDKRPAEMMVRFVGPNLRQDVHDFSFNVMLLPVTRSCSSFLLVTNLSARIFLCSHQLSERTTR